MNASLGIFAILALTSLPAFADSFGSRDISGFTPLPSMNVDPKEGLGNSLRGAIREGRLKDVQSLLERGADPSSTNDYYESALMVAARYNQIKAAQMLLERHADVNAVDSQDTTALMSAAKNCSWRIADSLIAASADVNRANHDSRTALIYAAMEGCDKIARSIVKVRGARLNDRDESGRTALDYAYEGLQDEVGGSYTEVFRAIRHAGGKTSYYSIIDPRGSDSHSVRVIPPAKGLR